MRKEGAAAMDMKVRVAYFMLLHKQVWVQAQPKSLYFFTEINNIKGNEKLSMIRLWSAKAE